MSVVDVMDCSIIRHDAPLYQPRRRSARKLYTVELYFNQLSEEKLNALRQLELGLCVDGEVLVPAGECESRDCMFVKMISYKLPPSCINSMWDFILTRQVVYIDVEEACVETVIQRIQDVFKTYDLTHEVTSFP